MTPMYLLALILTWVYLPIAIAGIFRTRARLALRAIDTAIAAITAGLWLILAIDRHRALYAIFAGAWVVTTMLSALAWDLGLAVRQLEASNSPVARQAWPYRI